MRSFQPETTIFNAAAAASTGLIMSVADFQKVVSGLKWVCATITARSAGTITLTCVPFDNE